MRVSSSFSFMVVSLILPCAFLMASDLVEVKTASGDLVQVHKLDLKLAYEKALLSSKTETNSEGAEINDDGSISIRKPNFKYNGKVFRIGLWRSILGPSSEPNKKVLLGICRFFGYAKFIAYGESTLKLNEQVVVLDGDGFFDYLAPSYAHGGTYYERYVDLITCR